MATITTSPGDTRLFPLVGQVNEDRDVVRIASDVGNAVLMSEADYDAWQTTLHLFSTSANSRRLIEGFAQARNGDLIHPGTSTLGI